jgi:hypothetical protein
MSAECDLGGVDPRVVREAVAAARREIRPDVPLPSGIDVEDVRQDAVLAALCAVPRYDPERGTLRAYFGVVAHNALRDLVRRHWAECRTPKDDWGRPTYVRSYGGETSVDPAQEDLLSSAEVIARARAAVSPGDWELLVGSMAEGAEAVRVRSVDVVRLNLARACAAEAVGAIAYPRSPGGMDTVKLPETDPAELPDCHPRGSEPAGYARRDHECETCPDKFTCLPEGLAVGLADAGVEDDLEVEAVLSGAMTYREAIERMRRRRLLVDNGGQVPTELGCRPRSLTPAARKVRVEVEVEPVPGTLPVGQGRPVRRLRRPAGASKPKKATRTPPTRSARLRRPQRRPASPARPGTMVNAGRRLPEPRLLDPDEMKRALARVRVGQSFQLRYGMQLVRKMRSGREYVVTITSQGFVFDGHTYSSLSGAAMHAVRRLVDGNDFFSLVSHACTEIRGADGRVLARRGGMGPALR